MATPTPPQGGVGLDLSSGLGRASAPSGQSVGLAPKRCNRSRRRTWKDAEALHLTLSTSGGEARNPSREKRRKVDRAHRLETVGSRLSVEMFRGTSLFFEEISACSFEHSAIRRMYSFFSGCTLCLFPFDTVVLVFSPCSPHTFACQKPSSSSIDAAKVQYTLNVGTFEQQADSFTPGSIGNSALP